MSLIFTIVGLFVAFSFHFNILNIICSTVEMFVMFMFFKEIGAFITCNKLIKECFK